MSDITYRSDLDRDLTPNEVDANFRSLSETKTETAVTNALAQDFHLLEIAQEQFEQELANQVGRLQRSRGCFAPWSTPEYG